jgi:hypothetical protein
MHVFETIRAVRKNQVTKTIVYSYLFATKADPCHLDAMDTYASVIKIRGKAGYSYSFDCI